MKRFKSEKENYDVAFYLLSQSSTSRGFTVCFSKSQEWTFKLNMKRSPASAQMNEEDCKVDKEQTFQPHMY